MIIPSTTKILIVPDFGHSAEDKAMAAFKEAIEAEWNFNAMIVDLRQMVLNEHPDEELKDPEVIEMCALCDTLAEEFKKLPQRKRILIVPDLFHTLYCASIQKKGYDRKRKG